MSHLRLVAESGAAVRRDRFLRLPEVIRVAGLSRSTIYALMKKGEFPKGVQLSARSVAWSESQVLQWVQDRIAGADSLKGAGQQC